MRRRGVTLLELLIATGLLVVLLTLAYSSLYRAWLLRTAGRHAAQRDREARAIVRGFESMLDQSSTPPLDAPANAWDANPEPHSKQIQPALPRASVQRPPIPLNCGIVGNGHCLAVFVDPARNNAKEPAHPHTVQVLVLANGMSDLRALRSQSMGQLAWRETGAKSEGLGGLVRCDATTQLFAGSSVLGVTSARCRNVGELAWGVTFRYFDGRQWYEEWDTHDRGELPRAVEMVLSESAQGMAARYRAVASPPRMPRGGAR